VLSSLYVGGGALSQQLLRSLAHAGGREVVLCTDFHRAHRRDADGSNAVERLRWLCAEARGAQVCLFRHPAAPPPWLEARLPREISELCGVLHAKVCVFDDDVLLTGANLSEDYFTSRQDRGLLLRDVPHLADFYAQLLGVFAARSHRLHASGAIEPPREHTSPAAARAELGHAVRGVLARAREAHPPPDGSATHDERACWVLPAVQLAAAGITCESESIEWLLRRASSPTPLPLTLCSPYLNLPRRFVDALLATPPLPPHASPPPSPASSDARATVLVASPTASSFWGARGVRSLVPQVYSALEQAFWREVAGRRVNIAHFDHARRGGPMTFHAKGLWLWPPPPASLPVATLVCSSNLGERSVHRDVEMSAWLVTTDTTLRQALQEEQRCLLHGAKSVDASTYHAKEHRVGSIASVLSRWLRHWC